MQDEFLATLEQSDAAIRAITAGDPQPYVELWEPTARTSRCSAPGGR